jgi:hypothetical protein
MLESAVIAALLVRGTLAAEQVPELERQDVRTDVARRLAAVNLTLVRAAGRWLARPTAVDTTSENAGFRPFHALHRAHLAILACAYLHLRYLPRQAGAPADDAATVSFDLIYAPFAAAYKRQKIQAWVSELRRGGFLAGDGDAIAAGPFLASIDEADADERADTTVTQFLLRRILDRHPPIDDDRDETEEIYAED